MTKPRYPRSAAYHEAAHAIARVYVGAPATNTRVFKDGTGYSGGGLDWRSHNASWGTIWDALLVLMAGAHAEAKATKRSLAKLRESHGLKDYVMASCLVTILARISDELDEADIWQQADKERRFFLRGCWHTIAKMGGRLQRTGYVSRTELRSLTKQYRKRLITSLNRPVV